MDKERERSKLLATLAKKTPMAGDAGGKNKVMAITCKTHFKVQSFNYDCQPKLAKKGSQLHKILCFVFVALIILCVSVFTPRG